MSSSDLSDDIHLASSKSHDTVERAAPDVDFERSAFDAGRDVFEGGKQVAMGGGFDHHALDISTSLYQTCNAGGGFDYTYGFNDLSSYGMDWVKEHPYQAGFQVILCLPAGWIPVGPSLRIFGFGSPGFRAGEKIINARRVPLSGCGDFCTRDLDH